MISLPPHNLSILPNRKQHSINIIVFYVPYDGGMGFESGGAFEIIVVFLPDFDGVVV